MAERRQQSRTLLLLLQALEGVRVTVELLDDSAVCGVVSAVDAAVKYAGRHATHAARPTLVRTRACTPR